MENSPTELEYDEVVVEKKKTIRDDSYFDGKLLELIGYRILAIIITVFTLTIASAWAEKLLIAYKIDHTVYNGKRLKFEGTGASLFVQRFKWIFFTIITFGIYSLWIPIKKEKWVVSNIHFEDEPFNKEDSYFDGGLLGLIGVNLFSRILTLISLGLLYPFVICYKQKWIAKHTIINRKKLVFSGKALSLVGHYLLWYLLTLITFGIFGLWVPIKICNWKAKNTHIKLKDEQESKSSVIPMIIGIILAITLIIGVGTFIATNYDKWDFENLEDFEISDIFKSDKKKSSGGEASIKMPGYISEGNYESNNSNYNSSNYKRNKKLTLIDGVFCYGTSHYDDLVAEIINGNIAISQSGGAVLLENTNAKYIFDMSVIAAENVDLYYITNNNDLYMIERPNANNNNQKGKKVTNSKVAEFIEAKYKDDGYYLRVLLTNGNTEDILYFEFPQY